MKKYFLYVAAFMLSLGGMMSACSDDDDLTKGNGNGAVEEINITKDNAANWYSYMINVANLLKEDATTLYDDWNTGYKGGASYASIFKSHNNSAYFGTANNCVRQIIEGCWDIANEVGDAKIGDPYDLYASGKHKMPFMLWSLGSAGILVKIIQITSFLFIVPFAVQEM